METIDFIQAAMSHNLEDPHSKALPACRRAGNQTASPLCLRLRHSVRWGEGSVSVGSLSSLNYLGSSGYLS
jgi:hypothetical protein